MVTETEALPVAIQLPSSAAQGDILYYDGSNWVVLNAGTSGKILKTQGAAANPVWGTDVPIGAVLPWAKTITGTPALPSGWVECDGSAISDAASPMDGQNTPNLNGANAFPRGNTTSGGTGGGTHSHTWNPDLDHGASAAHSTDRFMVGSDAGTKLKMITAVPTNAVAAIPTYVDMVFIIKIK